MPDTAELTTWVGQQFNKVLGVDPGSIRETDRIIDDLGADSIDVVEIVTAAERDFGLVVEEDEIYGVESVADLVALLDRLLNP